MAILMTPTETNHRLRDLPEWREEGNALVRVVKFSNYLKALEFVGLVGKQAEKMDHHPSIQLDYSQVTIKYSTHSAGGITDLDFQAAHIVEKLIKT